MQEGKCLTFLFRFVSIDLRFARMSIADSMAYYAVWPRILSRAMFEKPEFVPMSVVVSFRRGTLRRMGSVFPGLPRSFTGTILSECRSGWPSVADAVRRWGGMEAAYLFINDSFPDLRKTGDRCAGSLIWSLWALLRRNGRSCRDYRNSSAGCFSQDWRAVGEGSFLHDTIRKPRFLFTLDPVGVGRNELCPSSLAARAASPEGLLARRRIDPPMTEHWKWWHTATASRPSRRDATAVRSYGACF